MAESERPNPDGVSKEFDPRFSRAFQPGFDARVHREEPPQASPRNEQGTNQRRDPVEPQRTVDGVPSFAVTVQAATMSDSERSSGERTSSEFSDLYPIAWWRRVNPWFLVLWGLGVTFIALGGLTAVFSVEWQNEAFQGIDGGQIYFVLINMAMQGAPLLVVLGLATLTSTVVIQAARWHRR